jgi:UDP-N-acetylglucosamine--N-acetylmuramyl-(pentapeptide) pyrophosphoryl-undecaprenol N-acetylglucosamine transferase
MKILLTGGGTIGSVSPLLALAEEIKKIKPETEFLWLGTKHGPEEKLIKEYGIPFQAVSSGKIRRYFSWQNFIDPWCIAFGFFEARGIIKKFKPDIVLGAGGFVQVPVIWAASFLGVKSVIHQQDIRPTLSNKLVAGKARQITVSFAGSLPQFPERKVVLTGNPVRGDILAGSRERAKDFFHLEDNLPTILVIGGGTGALTLNELIIQSLKNLLNFSQVIHLTGRGKGLEGVRGEKQGEKELGKIVASEASTLASSRYHPYEFLTNEMKDAYAAADLVITRAGLSTLSEISVLGKPAILIPLPGHQEDNALYYQKNNAAVYLKQESLNPGRLFDIVKSLLENKEQLATLGRNIEKMMDSGAAQKMAEVVLQVIKE